MIVKLRDELPAGSMLTHGREYVVYWVDSHPTGCSFGICSDAYEDMGFPIYLPAHEAEVMDPRVNPLWVCSIRTPNSETLEPHSKFALLVAHPMQIAEERRSTAEGGYFVERMSNGDTQAKDIWAKIKSALDAADC